jgi:hypothetical protein
MADIKMPTTPRSAYDPQRPANTLLLTHVRELEKALVAAGRAVRRKKPQTEAQVAAYIRHLNRALYHQLLLPRMKRRRLDVPLDEIAPTRPRAKTKTRSASKKRGAGSTRRAKKAPRARKPTPSQRR